jgi:hypothetical protein
MNKDWQKNFWVIATLLLVQGATGILQAYIYSQEQPEDIFFVPLLVASSIFFVISLLLLVVFVMSARRARRLEGRTGETAPGRRDSASSVLPGAGQDDRVIKWFLGDGIILVLAILGFLLGILRLVGGIHSLLPHRTSYLPVIASMIIAGIWLSSSVLFFAVYVHRKRKPRTIEAPPRLARSSGQPKEAREE